MIHLLDTDGTIVCHVEPMPNLTTTDPDKATCPDCLTLWFGIDPGE